MSRRYIVPVRGMVLRAPHPRVIDIGANSLPKAISWCLWVYWKPKASRDAAQAAFDRALYGR